MIRKAFYAAILAIAALALAGCASQSAFVEAQKAALVRESDARVAEAQAIAAVAGKLDAGGAAAYAVMVAMRGAGQGAYQARVERPRDFLDYLAGVSQAIGIIGNVAVPIITVRESGKTSRAGFDRDVRVEEARQTGETGRVTAIGTAMANLGLRPTTSITVTAGGDSLVGSGTIDRRDCSTHAGNGAPGGTTPGSISVSSPSSVSIFPPSGGPGGAATGGC